MPDVCAASCAGLNPSPTHICLDELGALLSDLGDESKHVDFLLRVHHVDHGIYYYEGSRPPNSSTGVTGETTVSETQLPAGYSMRGNKTDVCVQVHTTLQLIDFVYTLMYKKIRTVAHISLNHVSNQQVKCG